MKHKLFYTLLILNVLCVLVNAFFFVRDFSWLNFGAGMLNAAVASYMWEARPTF